MAGGASEECGGNLQFLWLVLLLYVEIVFVLCAPSLNGGVSFWLLYSSSRELEVWIKKRVDQKKKKCFKGVINYSNNYDH